MTGIPNPTSTEIQQAPRRVGIISDIHGNHHALEAVLAVLDGESLDAIICCGDVVGYGGLPNECVETLRERKIPTIVGNHDHAALMLTDISNFNDIARAAVLWTKKVLREENAEYLRQLPLTIRDPNNSVYYVHSSPKEPGEWHYVLTMGEARTNFEYFTEQICFIGHSHQPFIIENNGGGLSCPDRPEIELRKGCRYLVNAGSVGQPRDHNPKACFAILDLEERRLEIRRCEYDLAAAQKAIMDAGLPRELSERLAHGM